MRRIETLLAFLLFAFAALLRADDFEMANQLYDQGKFADAKQLYERMVDRGEWSANLFFNLGNAAYRSDAPGRAILNYERALALDGTHAEARANLQWLRNQTGARVRARTWSDYAFPALSGDIFAIVAAVAGWGAIFCASAALFGRKAWGWTTLLALVAGYAVTGALRTDQDLNVAIVTAKETAARLAPADRASVAEPLPAGSRVRVLSERGEWTYCALPGGGRGWIPDTQIERVRLAKS
jgi:tetratricopeptide (TPR) repeat protein